MSNGLRCGDRFRPREEALDRAARLATVMSGHGVGPDSNVAVLARNGIEVVEAHLAARLLDANVVPLNWHGTGGDTLYILGQAEPLLLLGDADLLKATDASVAKLAFGADLDVLLAGSEPYAGMPQGTGSSLIFTSGTSGLPKGVKRLAANPEQAEHRRAVLRLIYDAHAENRALACGPLYHLFSLATTLSNFGAGAHVTIMERFDAEDVLRIVERDRITHTSFVPTMLVRLLRLPDHVKAKYDLSSLRHITQSGAPCPVEVKRALLEWLGPIIHETYGSTETGVMTQMPGPQWLKRPGSVGKPVLTGEVRVLGPDGETLPPHEVGDIYMWMHDAPDFTYLGDPEKRAAMEKHGLVTVGDMGYKDEDDFLYVCDRRSDMVLVGGANVYPAEIEAALLTHPDVIDAAAFGVPDEDMGEVLIAHVAPRGDALLDEKAMLAHLDGRLARTKWPRRIIIDRELPRLENGKLFKRVLRDRYLGKAAA